MWLFILLSHVIFPVGGVDKMPGPNVRRVNRMKVKKARSMGKIRHDHIRSVRPKFAHKAAESGGLLPSDRNNPQRRH